MKLLVLLYFISAYVAIVHCTYSQDLCADNHCHKNAKCVPYPDVGYYDCVCRDGRKGQGFKCFDFCLPQQSSSLVVGTPEKKEYNVKDQVKYRCSKPVYYMIKDDYDTVTCIDHKKWDRKPPTCIRKKCPIPMVPGNGYIVDIKPVYYIDDVAEYACNSGYALNPANAVKVCSADMTFQPEGKVTCTPIPCSKPMAPINGYLVKDKNSYNIGEVEGYKCNDGYRMSGSKSTTCRLGPSWSNGPPTCTLITCDKPMPGPNSSFKTPPAIRNKYVPDEYVEGKCKEGFRRIGTDKVVCVRDGDHASWSAPIVCELITCGKPMPGPNSSFKTPPAIRNKYVPDEYVEGECAPYYRRIGTDRVTCVRDGDYAAWSAPIVCELITCNKPSPPRYGYLDKPLKDSYNIGDIVKGGCNVRAFYQLDGDVDYIECVYVVADKVAIWTSFQCFDSCKGRCDKYFPGRRCACRHELCGPRKGRQCCDDIDICGRPSYP